MDALLTRWSLAASLLLSAVCIHLIARRWDDRHIFFMYPGRDVSELERSRARRVVWVNAGLAIVSVLAVAMARSDALVLAVLLGAPLGSTSLLIWETWRVGRSVAPGVVPSRFVVPLDTPPTVGSYLSRAQMAGQLGVLVLTVGALTWLMPQLPERIPMQFDLNGAVSRSGAPAELWGIVVLMVGMWLLVTVAAWGVARERWALPERAREEYATLQLVRRRTIVRMVEVIMLATNASMALTAVGLAYSAVPGSRLSPGVLSLIVIAGIMLGTLVPLAVFLPRAAKVRARLREMGGSNVLGTRPDGWVAGGLIYFSKDDPALFVPKRVGIGQTLNMARPGSWAFLAAVLLLPLVVTAVAMYVS